MTWVSGLFATGTCSTATTTTSTGYLNWLTGGPTASSTIGYMTAGLAQTPTQTQLLYLQQAQASALAQQSLQPIETRFLRAGEYELPDGAKLVIDSLGNYRLLDAEAKVVYRANRVREFNPYINASDLLEAFIEEVGQYDGVDQGEVLNLPIEAFINWIILEAAKRDGDPLDNLPSVESALPRARVPENP